MQAIGFTRSLEIDHPEALQCFEGSEPIPRETDVLVRAEGISFNPLDVKMRQRSATDTPLSTYKILGWDGCGTVVNAGSNANNTCIGRRVLFTSWKHMNTSQLSGQPPTGTAKALAATVPLIDECRIRTTARQILYGLTVDNVRAAHKQLESGNGIGKVVLQVLSA